MDRFYSAGTDDFSSDAESAVVKASHQQLPEGRIPLWKLLMFVSH
jgi:hypothetical protein